MSRGLGAPVAWAAAAADDAYPLPTLIILGPHLVQNGANKWHKRRQLLLCHVTDAAIIKQVCLG